MAQQRTVVLIDDLDGGHAEHTVAFSLDGQQYEIDLSTPNIQRLLEALAPFTTRARLTRTAPGAGRSALRPRTARTAARPGTPAATSTPPVGASISATGTAAGPPPPVPAALFSNPTQPVAPRTATAPKPDAAALFSLAT